MVVARIEIDLIRAAFARQVGDDVTVALIDDHRVRRPITAEQDLAVRAERHALRLRAGAKGRERGLNLACRRVDHDHFAGGMSRACRQIEVELVGPVAPLALLDAARCVRTTAHAIHHDVPEDSLGLGRDERHERVRGRRVVGDQHDLVPRIFAQLVGSFCRGGRAAGRRPGPRAGRDRRESSGVEVYDLDGAVAVAGPDFPVIDDDHAIWPRNVIVSALRTGEAGLELIHELVIVRCDHIDRCVRAVGQDVDADPRIHKADIERLDFLRVWQRDRGLEFHRFVRPGRGACRERRPDKCGPETRQ